MSDYFARCPACGSPIDYCQGHGDIGDPAGAAILARHDNDEHGECHPDGCDEKMIRADELWAGTLIRHDGRVIYVAGTMPSGPDRTTVLTRPDRCTFTVPNGEGVERA